MGQNGKVGIGTTNPQQVLHIDANKDTPAGFTSDDVVVSPQGYVGLGTISPSTRLDINSSTAGAIKIVDGTQKQNAFLRSDANGVGTWYVQGSIKSIVLGTWHRDDPSINSDNTGGTKNLNVSLALTPGTWMVNFGATFKMDNNVTIPYWLHLYLSDTTSGRTSTTFSFLGSGGANTGYAGIMMKNVVPSVSNANFISGSSIIKVQSNTTIWVLAENIYRTSPNASWGFTASNWENYFYAIPLDGN